ncbi:MAG TPA: VWA domain-containing protein [Saprospiraceae bacterium]|nr:VWA domain-containing protein [Saprospiraceae bacterium]
MFRFEHPEFFWLGILPVLIMAGFFLSAFFRNKSWARWGSTGSNEKVRSILNSKPSFLWFGALAAVLFSIAAVNPQWGFKTESIENKTADIYLCLDISNSMLAEDVAPNRLERARRFALDLVSRFKTDRIGMIVFAGNAYIQSPLTSDWHAIELYLNAAHPSQAGTQGTAIGEAIRLATKSGNKDDQAGGAIIIITDGEDHDSDAPLAVQESASKGWATYLVGVGTEQGGTLPVMINGNKDVKRDETGQPVVSKLNRQLMTQLAGNGNGKYYDLNDVPTIIEDLKSELVKLERSHLEKRSFSEHKSYFQWFLLPALLLVLVYVTVNYKFEVI